MRALHLAVSAMLVASHGLPVKAATSFDNYVDLELVVAVDVSGSMDFSEQQVQRDGYVAAFKDPEVIKAITSGPYGRIAVTYVRWAGAFIQETAVPWTVIGSKADAQAFAGAIAGAPLYTERGTSISGALGYSLNVFSRSPYVSDRRTIDISGDGSNNDGSPVAPVREKVLAAGVTINGLPIVINPSGVPGAFVGLDAYYQDCVIGGPGSFMIPIQTRDGFAPAIRRKLILEIAWVPPEASIIPVQSVTGKVNCAAVDRPNFNTFFP